MKKQRFEFRTILALILVMTIILLPFDTLALTGQAVTSEGMATPDEAESTQREKDDDLAQTGANILDGDGTEESPYIIATSDDWDTLSESINSGSTEYSGKYFELTDDISVTTVLGNRPDSSSDSNDNVFCGTFDGGGHKLTVNLNGSDFGAAPFAIAYNATIKNLRVDGTINSTAYHASGLVAASKGKSIYDESFLTIQNVTVSVDVTCTSHIAGLIGHAHAANITMENVVFDGSLNASNIQGGMIGWGGLGNGARFNASFKDCLFAGTYNTNAAFYPVAFANGQGTATLINDFYTTSIGGGGSPIPTTGDGQVKLLAATVEKDGAVSYFDNINTAADGSNWVEGSTLRLMTDVTTGSTINVPSGEHTLDLNGHGIKMTGSGSVINVGSGAKLSINDSNKETEHRFTVSNEKSNGAGLATVNDALTSGYKTFTGGYITGGYALTGGGININGGTLNMDGGSVIGNRADNNGNKGGGLCISNNGKVTLSGGSISYNYAQNAGGGVALRDGDFTMTGGEISHNRVSHAGGAGMAFHYTGTFTMTGGAIINNHAGWTGGGIDCYSANEGDARIIISGSPVITDNLADNNGSSIDSVNNVMLRGNIRFTVDSELTDKAAIDVLLQNGPGEFTSGWKDKMGNADPAKYFTSTDSSYSVFLNNNGEAEIGIVPHEHDDLSFTKWSDTTALPPTAGNYCLSADVTISSRWDVPAGTTNLCLNGHSITRTNASSNTGMVINVGSGAVLNLYECDETIHYYTVDDPSPNGSGLGKVVDESNYNAANENARGTFKGGYITGGSVTGENTGTSHLVGGGVNVDSGSFTLNGGTIIGNSVTWNGGGVKVRGKNASFTMNGGAILANWNRYYGGGISVGDNNAGNVCKLKINGGTIRHNWSGRNGGAIHLDGKAHTVLINGGNIIDNYTDGNLESTGRSGGGILTDVTSVQLSGTPVIKGNAIKSGVSNDVSVRANGSDRLDLSGHLKQGADVGIYVPGWTSNANADYMVATGAEQSDIRYVHYDVPSEGLLLFCDGSKDWICLDGALVELSGGHHTHQAGTVWVSSLPVAAVTAGETTTLYGSLDAAVSAWTAGSTLKLLTDVTTSSTITVHAGEHTLDLNGHGIKAGTTGCSVINVGSGVTLDLTDSDQTKTHKFDVPDGAGLAALNETSGTYTVNGGYITGGNSNQGGGVYVKGGTLILTGGTIIGNQAQREGGGVIIESGSCTMNGGAIIYNKSQTHWGGGINVGGPFNMSGGVVSHNYAGEGAGGVHCHSLVMTGGSITDNYAAGSYAGGVNVNNNATLSGNITITDNTNNTGKSNLYCKSVIIADTLSDTSSIGIKTQSGTGTFTTGWKDKMGDADPSKYFTSDNNSYSVFLNSIGEAEINLPPVASIISGETTTNYSSISDAVNAWTAGSTLKLVDDITTGGTVTVPSGEHTLDLNGHTLRAGSAGYSVITVGSGADLTINDSAGKDGKITGGSVGQNYGGGVTVDGGTLTLKGGAVSGNANTYGGIGNCGGGVHVRNSGKFYMEGGEISDNTSYVGGGVCSDASATTVSITGGVIKSNKTDRFGSAIWAGRSSSAVFRIVGDVQIVDNISTWTADKDGEASLNFSRLLLSGDPTVHGDWKTSGTSSPNTHINLDNSGSGIQTIELDGALTNSTGTPKITISPIYRWSDLSNGQTFVFTNNWNQYMGTAHPADYFKVDDSVSGVKIIRKNGEAAVTGSSDLGDLYITFDANEGEGTMAPQLAAQTNVTLNKNTFTREGYAFAGWNTEKDGSGTGYTDKGSVTLTGDLTLYAQWMEPVASIISGETTTDYGYLSDAVNAWTAGSTLKLLTDVTTNSTVTVPTGEHTLDLNGYGILMTGNARVLTINQNVSLELNDSDPDRIHYITLTDYRGTAVSDSGEASVSGGNGVIQVTGGYLTGGYINNSGSHDKCGAGVFNWGTFVMNSGSIVGNFMQNNSGAGVRNSGTFTMNDGTIAFNKATGNGGGVTTYVPGGGQGKMTMTGGVISDNYCGSYGGGIQLAGPFELTGGSVIRNTAGAGGSGVFYDGKNDRFKLSGNPVIKDNSNNDDLYLGANATFMINGSLTEEADIHVLMNTPAEFTVGWKNIMGNADPSKYFTSDNDDYIITLNDSGEACLRYPDVSNVAVEGFEGDYDGAAHSITVTAPDGAEIKYGTSEGSYTLTDNPTYTDAGTYTVYYEVSKEKHSSVYGSAQVKIDQINATVTITGHNTTVDYDGKAHSADGYDATPDSKLYDVNKDFIYHGRAEAVRTDAGTTEMGLTAENFENTNANFDTVTFEITDGYMTVVPVDVVVTVTGHNDTVDYDGKAHSAEGYDVEFSNPLYSESDFTFSGTAKAERTDAGTTGMGLAAEQFVNTNRNFANVTFDITDGYMTVEPINVKVVVTGNSDTIDYDGKSHTVSGYTFAATSALYTESDFTFSGTAEAQRTDAGTTNMGLNAEQFVNTSNNFAEVTFEVTDGSVTIDPIDVTVTVTGHNTTADYDGKAHSADGYDAKASTDLYDVSKDFIFSGRAAASRTNAGTTKMGLTAEQFENTNSNFATVTFDVTDGYVTIDPIDVIVTITGHHDTVDYDGKAHSIDGYDAAASSDLYDVNNDFTFSGRAEAVRTNAGKTEMGLSADQFANTNSNFATVTFDVTDGYIKIDPIDVTVKITGYYFTTDYDGEAHSAEGYYSEISDPLYTEDDFSFSGTAKAERTDAGTTKMGLASNQFENTNDNFATVVFDVTDGYVTINPIDVTVMITGHNSTADYDSDAHIAEGYDVAFSDPLYTEDDFTFSGTAKAERTDAGTTEMGLAAEQFKNTNDNFAAVTFEVTDGYTTIDPIDVTVTITGHNSTADYDGKAHSVDGYDAVASSDLYDVTKDFIFSGTAKAERTNAGTTEMGLAAEQFENTNNNFETVTFEVTDGYMTIDPINVTVTITGHNSTADYDGESHSIEGYDAVVNSDLYDVTKDFTFSGTAKAERTDAGTTEMGLAAEQFKNTNSNFAAVTFEVTDGYMTVKPINITVTITGHNSTVDYDGKAHSVDGYDAVASSDLYDVTKDFKFSGTAKAERTNAGTTEMGLAAEQFENTNDNFATVTFEVTDGYTTIDPIDVTVTVTGHNSTVNYDGEAHSVDGYDAVASSDLYDVSKDFTFSGTAKAERTDAGTTEMGLSADQFKNTNSNFATVTFDVTDGYMTVKPISVTVTITGHNSTADYDSKAHSIEGYDVKISDPLYAESDFTFSGTAKAERTDAGTTNMGLSAGQFENINNNFANVTFDITDGYVKIDPINVTVTITGHKNTVDYDGNAHSADGYNAAANSDLYDVTKDFTFSGRAEAVRTNAGTSMMGLSAAQFENTNSNFATVTFEVTDGYLTVNTVDAVITTAPHAKSELIDNGSEQELIVAGSVDGGTLYYAIGKNANTSPADNQYKTALPVGKDVGNYYIWYKVKGDSNHNDLAPSYVKVTMAEQGWGTVSGGIVDKNNKPVKNATVTLTAGGKVIDEIISGSDGSYYFTVPAGIYDIVVESGDATVTEMVNVADRTTYDVTVPDSDTDSLLDVVDSDDDIVVGGLSKEAALIREQESVPDSQNVTVKMTVRTISGSETEGSTAISDYAPDKNFKFYDFKVEKTVGSLTTELDATQSILEIAIPCSFTNKSEFAVYHNSGSGVQTLTESDSKAAGTYRVDQQNGMVYIYTDTIATYAVGYKPYYSVTSDMTLGSYTGDVSVTLTKDGSGEKYELNNVSLQNISFKGIPKGTYSMTVTWTDGAENTITTPFIIK